MRMASQLLDASVSGAPLARGESGKTSSARIREIDVARGAAMFFVCLSHFSGAYLWLHGIEAAELLATMSMIASPSFVLISGMTLGVLGTRNPEDLPHLRIRLLDRGLFLLLVGHFVLSVSQLRRNTIAGAFYTSFLTDALAVAMIVGPRIVSVTGRSLRIAISLMIYCAGWVASACWLPSSDGGTQIQRYVFGSLPTNISGARTLVFPVVPWLAVYLLGTVFGEYVGDCYRKGERARARKLFLVAGLGFMCLGAAIYFVTRRIQTVHALVTQSMLATLLTSPTLKFPPGPAFIAYFGGSGLVFMWLVLELQARGGFPWLVESLRRVGYASLPVFILQYFLYSALIRPANLRYTAWWPLLFLGTLVPMWTLATLWCRADEANRLLTVGVTSWLESGPRRLLERRLRAQQAPYSESGTASA